MDLNFSVTKKQKAFIDATEDEVLFGGAAGVSLPQRGKVDFAKQKTDEVLALLSRKTQRGLSNES